MSGGDAAAPNWHDQPTEVWLQILKHLRPVDLSQVRLVSRRFYYLVSWTGYNRSRRLKITPSNYIAIKERLEAAASDSGRQPAAAEISREMHFNCVDVIGLEDTPEWCYVLRELGADVVTLKLSNCHLFPQLPELMPHVENIVMKNVCDMCPNNPLLLYQFTRLARVDMSCTEMVKATKYTLTSQLGHDECRLALRDVAVDHCSLIENDILKILQRNADTLASLALHFVSGPVYEPQVWGSAFRKLTRLRSTKFTGCLRNAVLDAIYEGLSPLNRLHTIDLAGNVFLDDELLIKIVNKWQNSLEVLDIMFCVHITDEAMVALKSVRHTLRVLNVSFCRMISPAGLLQGIACERNTTLRSLYLNDVRRCNASGLQELIARLPDLMSLNVQNCTEGVTDEVVAAICQHQTKLRVLVLDDCSKISDDAFNGYGDHPYPITRLRHLETLSFRSCRKVSDRTVMNLRLPHLTTLRFGYCHRISSAGIAGLVRASPNIQELVITSCLMLDDEAAHHIANGLRNLRTLNLSNCLNLTSDAIHYLVENCKTLQKLCVGGIDAIDEATMRYVSRDGSYLLRGLALASQDQ